MMIAGKRVFIIIVCILISRNLDAQTFSELTLEPIKSINWRDYDSASLRPFIRILGQYDLLMLSEGDHGDGLSIDAQCMILKGLIDAEKIQTIYLEASWIIVDRINEILKNEGKSGIKKCIKYMQSSDLLYWADNGFWDFLALKIIQGKVSILGLDVGASTITMDELLPEALSLPSVNSFKVEHAQDYKNATAIYPHFDAWDLASTFYLRNYELQSRFISAVIEGYQQNHNDYRIKQWNAIKNFFYWMYRRSELLKGNHYANLPEGEKQTSAVMSIRDSLMADHFLGIYDTSVHEKAVISVANYHAIRRADYIDELSSCCKYFSTYIFGDLIAPKVQQRLYSVCFITGSGHYGINDYYMPPKKIKYSAAPKNSLEYYLLKEQKGDYYFGDLVSSKLKYTSFKMRVFYKHFFEARWSNHFSGFFYIRTMEPLYFLHPEVLND